MNMPPVPTTIEEMMVALTAPAVQLLLAQAAHEQNRVYCALHGDLSQVPWEQAPQWQRDSAVEGVAGVIAGNTPEQQHEAWMRGKVADGWRYGEVKDAQARTHPAMLPYAVLAPEQKVKDLLFLDTIKMHINALYVGWGLAPLPAALGEPA